MKKKLVLVPLAAGMFFASVTGVAFAGQPETTDGFVCPVIGGNGGENAYEDGRGPFVRIGGGDLTIVGPDVTVPVHATNDDGAGTPPGDHAAPGDSDYTAIWAGS